MPKLQFTFFSSVTKFMQSLGQGNNMLSGFLINTHSTLNTPMILWGINKNPSISKQWCYWLLLYLGDKPISGSSVAYGV